MGTGMGICASTTKIVSAMVVNMASMTRCLTDLDIERTLLVRCNGNADVIRQADDGQDAVRDRPLLDAQMIGAACGLHGNLSRFYQDYVFRTVFAVDRMVYAFCTVERSISYKSLSC